MQDSKNQVLILYSGGADSTLLLEIAERMGKKPFALLIDYGQLHKEELTFAEQYVGQKGIPYNKVSLVGLSAQSGLTGDGEKGRYGGVAPHYVPARNTMFLSIAASEAESQGIREIWYGPDMSDFFGEFPDCKQEYVGKINSLFETAFSYPIKVYAPTLGLTKDMVLGLLENFGIPKDQLFSGYGQYT
jgi:7-cyano-7-deazaguanine synthase